MRSSSCFMAWSRSDGTALTELGPQRRAGERVSLRRAVRRNDPRADRLPHRVVPGGRTLTRALREIATFHHWKARLPTQETGTAAVPAPSAVNHPFQLEFTASTDTEPELCHMQPVSSGLRATTW